jgi:hypothetical protein
VKWISIVLALLAIALIASCSSFQGNEKVNQQPGRTVFKAADEGDPENVDAPLNQKVPGEETKRGR